MTKRGRSAKIETLDRSSAVPNSQTEMVLNEEGMNSIDLTSDVRVQNKRSPAMNSGKSAAIVVRRSKRFQSSPNQTTGMELVVKEVNVVESDKVEEPIDEENHPLEQTHNLEAVQPSKDERPYMANLNYRRMYIDSQKKVKLLRKKNKLLSKKLENALGKIEAYVELTPILSSLSKANETLSTRPWAMMKRLRS